MKVITLFDIGAALTIGGLFASPALAGSTVTPAPIAGVGIGAFVVLGAGYRMLRNRINR
jgi:hypothetical protein